MRTSHSSRSFIVILVLLLIAAHAPALAQKPDPVNDAREFLSQHGIVISKEFTPPMQLDTKNKTRVELAGFLFTSPARPETKLKGLRAVIKPSEKLADERTAYLDLDEAMALSAAFNTFAEISTKWTQAKKKANADCLFASRDGFKMGFFVNDAGAHEGYFAVGDKTVFFAMSPEMMTAVKGPLDKMLADLKRY